jgi:hypothetical protein
MCYVTTFFAMLLFFVLSPGVLLSLPKNGNVMTKALVHAVVFGVLFYLTHTTVSDWGKSNEGFISVASVAASAGARGARRR